MDSSIIEWRFDCDRASESAREVFNMVIDRGWLLEHGIHPFDDDAAWEEVRNRLSHLKEPCGVLTAIRITEGNATTDEQRQIWSRLYQILAGGAR